MIVDTVRSRGEVPYPDADLLSVTELLSGDERTRLASLRQFFQDEVRPVATELWNRAAFPFELLPRLAALDLVGRNGRRDSALLTGLAVMEFARADTSLCSFFLIHSELFTEAIRTLGSDAHRRELLPALTDLTNVGAFALTEPDHGSDVSREMETTAERVGDEWILRGSKRWIGNASLADYILVWARDTGDSQVKGFLVEHGRAGLSTSVILNKIALRIVQNADVVLDDVHIPFDNWLPGTTSFRDTDGLLKNSRTWVAWQAVGQQFAAIDIARSYALERKQFGKPLAARQIVQEQLVRMVGNATTSLSLMIQLARLQEEDALRMEHAALAKATCSARMRETVAIGRAMLGGNGISTDFEMAKVFADAEAIYSYEGSYEINALIVGRAFTGLSAFD
ncbi:MAG TPA: acyl-CoA dehydrogenase family protein [Galbitalea sp.]|jgi:glutaryl-CoA dehydrogenase|nr:acyl-CoA dehydrogenase family protein [Galbitalea sp.]